METYLVTGGAGFIGSNFIKTLLDKNCDIKVVNVDKLTYAGSLNHLAPVMDNKNHVFIREDICNGKRMEEIFREYRPGFVVNFAAETHVDRSIKDSEAFVKTNVLGTQVLLKTSMHFHVKKYVQISTDEVYGSAHRGMQHTEEALLNPSNPYAASKAAADLLALSFWRTYGFPAVVSRCTNNYGPNQNEEKLIPLIIKCCLLGEKIPIYGTGKNIRDWLHVSDHCSAIDLVLHRGRTGEVYNVSAYNEKENLEIASLVIGRFYSTATGGADRCRTNEDLIQFVNDRKGHDLRYSIDSTKLRAELGWKPVQHLEKGLEDTIKWYVDNKAWVYKL